jgi:hypothetical protein
MLNWILCTDSDQDAIDLIVRHAKEKNLPLIKDVEKLKQPYWVTQRRKSAAELAKESN